MLKAIGADPEFTEVVRVCELRIVVNPGFRSVDLRPLQQLGFRFWLVEREEGPGPTMSIDEIDGLVRKRAEELGLRA